MSTAVTQNLGNRDPIGQEQVLLLRRSPSQWQSTSRSPWRNRAAMWSERLSALENRIRYRRDLRAGSAPRPVLAYIFPGRSTSSSLRAKPLVAGRKPRRLRAVIVEGVAGRWSSRAAVPAGRQRKSGWYMIYRVCVRRGCLSQTRGLRRVLGEYFVCGQPQKRRDSGEGEDVDGVLDSRVPNRVRGAAGMKISMLGQAPYWHVL
eukprot:6193919-Pleurochrysis_carterae.AAC.2